LFDPRSLESVVRSNDVDKLTMQAQVALGDSQPLLRLGENAAPYAMRDMLHHPAELVGGFARQVFRHRIHCKSLRLIV
jgi:hypothetical protein